MQYPLSFAAMQRTAWALSGLALASSSTLAQVTPLSAPPIKARSLAQAKATATSAAALNPNVLGSLTSDLVFTPVTPCRMVDTRNALGPFTGGQTRTFDFDGLTAAATTYAQQGGVATSCNLPYGTATAAALNITVTNTATAGYLSAWGKGTQPNASVLNWFAGETIANTTIVPIVPGQGTDFSIFASTGTDVVIDVVGYYAAPTGTVATAPTFGVSIQMPASIPANALYTAAPVGLSGVGLFSTNDIARQSVPLASACRVSGFTAQVFGATGAASLRADMYYGPLSVLAGNSVYGGPGGPVSCTVNVPAGTSYGSCTSTGTDSLEAGWIVGHDLQVVSGAAALQNAQVFVTFSCQ
jgi:hypothetical protein